MSEPAEERYGFSARDPWSEATSEDAAARADEPAAQPADPPPPDYRQPVSGRLVSAGGTDSPRPDRRPVPRRTPPPGNDLLGGLQKWLIKSSARNMRREFEDQVRKNFGGGRAEPDDVWGTATTEVPPDPTEAPECAWCPICRAARRMRENGPGLGSQLSTMPDVVASAVQDAIAAFDGVLSRSAPAHEHEPPADRSPGPPHADSATDPAEAERAPDEPGDRG
jgi:hypothetical protein